MNSGLPQRTDRLVTLAINDREVSLITEGASPRAAPRQESLTILTIQCLARWVSVCEQLLTNAKDYKLLGAHLYHFLFDSELGSRLDALLMFAEMTGSRVRIEIQIDSRAQDQVRLPWEFLYRIKGDDAAGYGLGYHSLLTLARTVSGVPATPPALKTQHIRILVVCCKPAGLPSFGDVAMLEFIEKLPTIGPCTVTTLQNVSSDVFFESLKKEQPDIIHFIGHGRWNGTASRGELAFCEPEQWVAAATIAAGIRSAMSRLPRLALLHSCLGAFSEPGLEVFSGATLNTVAAELLGIGIPAVVAMQYEIIALDANRFATHLYRSLFEGRPIDVAVQEARHVIAQKRAFANRCFGTPVLYKGGGGDGYLFDWVTPAPPVATPDASRWNQEPRPAEEQVGKTHRDEGGPVLPSIPEASGSTVRVALRPLELRAREQEGQS